MFIKSVHTLREVHGSLDYLRVTSLTYGLWSGPWVGTVPGTGVTLWTGRALTWRPWGCPGASDRAWSGDQQWFSAAGISDCGRPISVYILCVLALLNSVVSCSAATRERQKTDRDRWWQRQISQTIRRTHLATWHNSTKTKNFTSCKK